MLDFLFVLDLDRVVLLTLILASLEEQIEVFLQSFTLYFVVAAIRWLSEGRRVFWQIVPFHNVVY